MVIDCPLYKNAKSFPDSPALIWGTRSISWQKLNGYVLTAVKDFKGKGLQRGDYVALVEQNRIECMIVLLALWRLGVIVCPLNPKFPPDTLVEGIGKLNVKMVISSSNFLRGSRRVQGAKILIEDIVRFDARQMGQEDAQVQGMDLDQAATVILTSATTGQPKMVVHSLGNHYYNALGSNEAIPLGNLDVWVLSLPLFHVSGLGIIFRTLLSGASMIVPQATETVTEALMRPRATHISLVPAQLFRLLKNQEIVKRLKNFKCILLGGSSAPGQLLEEALSEQLPVYLTYGLTEMASQVATGWLKDASQPCAKVLSWRELKVDVDGEILVKGQTLCTGYLKGNQVALPLKDGWFATGDLGRMDNYGCLIVSGRKDNMFISGGENIQPEEIEEHLRGVQGIHDALVVPVEDEEFGQRPVALIRLHSVPASCADVRARNLQMLLEQTLPKFKIPVRFYRWPDDERDSMKIDRTYFKSLIDQADPRLARIE